MDCIIIAGLIISVAGIVMSSMFVHDAHYYGSAKRPYIDDSYLVF